MFLRAENLLTPKQTQGGKNQRERLWLRKGGIPKTMKDSHFNSGQDRGTSKERTEMCSRKSIAGLRTEKPTKQTKPSMIWVYRGLNKEAG